MTINKSSLTAITLTIASLAFAPGAAVGEPQAAAKPLEPISAILAELKTHDVIAMGEGNHGNEQGAAFRQKLYHDRRFQTVIDDIVVESGNGRYQAMMDRYIAGEDVPEKQLRKAWLETTQPNAVWDRPIYAEMFASIRDVNRTLPKSHQIRVLLGDTPYILDAATHEPRTNDWPADIVKQAVAKGHKVLMVYGDMHYLRHEATFNLPGKAPEHDDSIVTLLQKTGVKVFSIWTFSPLGQDLDVLQPDIDQWPDPSLTLIKDTPLGLAPFGFYYPRGSGRYVDGGVTIDVTDAIGGTMQDQFDALLYIGKKQGITFSPLQASLCSDPDYVEMRAKRMSVMKMADGSTAGDQFGLQCKAVLEKR